ncbi:MAG: TolC family protein [Nitrospirota bacterium]
MRAVRQTAPGFSALSCVASLLVSALLWPTGTASAARELTLEQALELAQQHSPVLKASRQDLRSAEAQRQIARSAYMPKLEAVEAWTNTNNPAQAFGILLNQGRFTQAGFDIGTLNRPGSTENYRSALHLTQPVYNGGRERLGLRIADVGHAASTEGVESTRQNVLFTVTRAYYDLALAKAVRGIARETVQIAEANAKQIASRYKGGTVVKSDVLQAEVRLAAVREEAIRADQMVRVAAIALRHAIGLDEPVDVVEGLTAGEMRPHDLEAAVATALEGRPDYRMLAAELRKAEMATQLAKSAYLPNFNLQGSFENNSTFPLGPNGQTNYAALGIVSVNLFNGMQDAAQVRKARAQEQKARELLAAKRREIEVEVVEAYYAVAAARERLAVSESAVAQAEENLRIIRNRYESGIAPVLDLFTAEMVLNQAKHNRMRALYDERIGHARQELVTGQFRKGQG